MSSLPRDDRRPLTIVVSICFADAIIKSKYQRTYTSSADFEPTDRICNGMLRRIEHCSNEFITRKDSGALNPSDGSLMQKPMRFEVQYKMVRKGVQGRSDGAERTFRSYQKQPLTVETTREVVFHSHEVVGLFLQRHDTVMTNHDPKEMELLSVRMDAPLSPLYIPQTDLVSTSRMPGFEPGYAMELSVQSRMSDGPAPVFDRLLEVESLQAAPLTHIAMEGFLDQQVQAIERMLASQQGMPNSVAAGTRGGSNKCASGKDLVEITLRVVNKLGPSYGHAQRSVLSNVALSRSGGCEALLRNAEVFLTAARNKLDSELDATDDFEFRVLELQGWGWTVQKPEELKFRLDSSRSYPRRTIEAAIDRIETCIRDVIRGHEVSIRFSAYNRGHRLLEKAVLARKRRAKLKEWSSDPDRQKLALVSRLRHSIGNDLEMVCKDTCSIDDIDEHALFMQDPIGDVDAEGRSKPKESWPQSTAATAAPDSCQETPSPDSQKSATPTRRAFSLVNHPRRFTLATQQVKRADEPFLRQPESTTACENRTHESTLPSRPLTASGLLGPSKPHQPRPTITFEEVKMDEIETSSSKSRKSRTPLFISATLKAAKRSLKRAKRRKSTRDEDLSSPTSTSSSRRRSVASSLAQLSMLSFSKRDLTVPDRGVVSKETGLVLGAAHQEALVKTTRKAEQDDVLPLEGVLLYSATTNEEHANKRDERCTMVPVRTLACEDEQAWLAPFIKRRNTLTRSTQTESTGDLQEDSPDGENMDISMFSEDSQLSHDNHMDSSIESDRVSTVPSTPGLSVDNECSSRGSFGGPIFLPSPECAAVVVTERGSNEYADEDGILSTTDRAGQGHEGLDLEPTWTDTIAGSMSRPIWDAVEGDSASGKIGPKRESQLVPSVNLGVQSTEETEGRHGVSDTAGSIDDSGPMQASTCASTTVGMPPSVPTEHPNGKLSVDDMEHASDTVAELRASATNEPTKRPVSDDWFTVLESSCLTPVSVSREVPEITVLSSGLHAAGLTDATSEYSTFISAARMKALRNPSLKQSLQSLQSLQTLSSPASLLSVSDAASCNGRDSVDTYHRASSDGNSRHASDDDADAAMRPYRPFTAGHLGLRESPLATTLTRKRFTLPVQWGLNESTASRPSSSGIASRPKREGRDRRVKSTSDALETSSLSSSRPSSSAGDVLPRVMVLGAVVAVAARFLHKGY